MENTVTITTAEYADLIKKDVMLDAFINALITGAGFNKYSKDLNHDDRTVNTFLMAFVPDRYEEQRAELMEIENDG